MDGFDLLRIWMGSVLVIDCTEEGDGSGLDFTFVSVEDESVFTGDMHEVMQSSVVFSIVFAMHNNVISNSYDAFTVLNDLVHHSLKYVLGAGKSKW